MANDHDTNEFIRACTIQAARFLNMNPPQVDAAREFANAARSAALSPQKTAPLHHYSPDLAHALNEAYGMPWTLADTSNRLQEEAIAAWMWLQDSTGINPDIATTATTISDAVTEMRTGGEGWRTRMREALRRDFNRQKIDAELAQ